MKCTNLNIIRAPIVRTVAPNTVYKEPSANYVYFNASKLVPIAKQGGSSCYQSACMNGGTCYSAINPPSFTTTTSTTANYNTSPLCVSLTPLLVASVLFLVVHSIIFLIY
jgi:hypothetical protein